MTNILVTGGAGYIGSRTCRALAEAGFIPIAYDNLSRGHEDFVRWGPLVRGDILDAPQIRRTLEKYEPAACVHFAAYAYVGESVSNPLAYYKNNVVGSQNLLDELHRSKINRLVFSSTCSTYGVPESLPIDEQSPQRPINPYGRTKLIVEQMLQDMDTAHAFRSVSLRYFNACGAHEDGVVGEAHDPEPHLIPRAIMAALGQIPALEVMGTDYPTRDGTPIRDYIHIADLAAAHVLALKYLLDGGKTDFFNLGIGHGYTVREVIRSVEHIAQSRVPFIEAPRRPGDPSELVSNPQKARSTLGFNPRFTDIDAMIRSAWRWHAQKPNALL